MTWVEWIERSEFFAPRGLEASVPALAALRREIWDKLPEAVQMALHLADYISLEKAVCLERAELEVLELRIPGPIVEKCRGLPVQSDHRLFGLSEVEVIGALNEALAGMTM
ncbi:MAG: hypothetical protein KGN02_01275 [bacterium]|nr:hypothetical protein [bacterium]